MLAKIKDQYVNQFEDKNKFEWFIKVIKRRQKRNKGIVKLENWLWYLEEKLEIQKEYKWKQKKDKGVQINLNNINTLLKDWEKDIKINTLEKECESWMADYNQIKKEKLALEIKYNSLADRVGLLVSTKSNSWKIFAITYVSVDFLYILIKYLWI